MKTYPTIRETPMSNLIVKELNAGVCILTFDKDNRLGIKKADLYKSKHQANVLVGHNTCPPTGCEFVETVNIILETPNV